MKAATVEEFEAVKSQLAAARGELLVLVKKNPNDALSTFKLGVVNGLLRRANALVPPEERPMADFVEFSTEALPSTSDAVLVIGQYLIALENFRARRVAEDSIGQWYWLADDGKRLGDTYPPRRHSG
jgi:hypothetical protein